jgi:hypothetical protein
MRWVMENLNGGCSIGAMFFASPKMAGKVNFLVFC